MFQGVGVHRYEQVGLVAVGYFGAFVQRYENICLACIYHLHVRIVLLHISAERKGHIQIDVLFLRIFAQCTRVTTAMTGIYDKNKLTVSSTDRQSACGKQCQK